MFWFLTKYIMLAAMFGSLIVIEVTIGHELLDGPVLVVPALFAGGVFASVTAFAIAGYRHSELVGLEEQGGQVAQIPRSGVPRPADSWFAIGAGLLAAAIVYLSV
jgi:hypothetical protein